ncbi:hypothetical protein [Ancylobacter sp.]|uniref:hypothetical protein n=1 Tax=Ancylobacter sp. TaxID=1872567 RepID=UPI003D14211A
MITTIIRSVACELSYTITQVIENDRRQASDRLTKAAYAEFLKDWGVQAALNLTIVERSSLNPTVLLTPATPASSLFTLSGGVSGSAEATRLQKTNVFYTVKDLYRPGLFSVESKERGCRDPSGNKEGSLLVDSDLRLSSLLEGRIGATVLNFAASPGAPVPINGQSNVISQTVQFKIVTSGGITPTWTLVRAVVNPTGTFASAGRDRTHELVLTFGPVDRSYAGRPAGLTYLAEQTHLFTQLQTGLQRVVIPLQ